MDVEHRRQHAADPARPHHLLGGGAEAVAQPAARTAEPAGAPGLDDSDRYLPGGAAGHHDVLDVDLRAGVLPDCISTSFARPFSGASWNGYGGLAVARTTSCAAGSSTTEVMRTDCAITAPSPDLHGCVAR
ncbi:hypothetical protein GCM10027615_08560 [Plantactinospora veratri]